MTVRFVRTVCPRDCYDTCTLKVEVENERIVSVKGENAHPVTKGFLCPRGTADGKRAYSERRVLKPQIRVGDKPTDTFREATWSEALDIIIEKLEKTLQEHGRETVLHLDYAGTMGLLSRSYAQRLWNALGAASHDASICSKSGHAGIGLHYGRTYGVQPDMLPELELIVFWGFNARVSSPHMWAQAENARQEKGTIIVAVDPRRSPTAEAADIWLSPKPGSDIALTYGLAHILIEKGWVDTDFVEEWCQGYSEYREEAVNWGRERVEETTGLNWMDIESLARLYHERKSSATMIGIGLQKSTQGADMVRAVSLIPPLLGLHRGFYYSNGQGNYVDGGIVTGNSLKDKDRTTFSQVALGEVLERGDIKFLWVNSMNPAVTIPNQDAVRKGLIRDDIFTVVHETHWTETTRYADVVLPSPTFLEKDDLLLSYSHRYVTKSNKVIEPMGESRDEVWLTKTLAERLKLKEEWLTEEPWKVLETAFSGALKDGSFKDIVNGQIVSLRLRPVEEYQTPSGRIEFYSETALKLGATPLPLQQPVEDMEDGFTLITSCIPNYTHSQFQEVYGPIEAVIWLHPEDAEELDISDGAEITLSNKQGKVSAHVKITDRTQRGVIWSPRLWRGLEGQPQNRVIQGKAQSLGGGPTFHSTKVKIGPVN